MRDRARELRLLPSRGGGIRAVVALLCLAWSCLSPAQKSIVDGPLSGSIRIVGTDTMKEVMDRWVARFTALHPAVHIELTAKGAMTAAPALSGGFADLAPLGREFTPAELAAFRSKHGYDPTGFPVALGSYDVSGRTVALAFFVNQSNPIARLSFRQLDAIYCTSLRRGSARPIITWGQLGIHGEWGARPIHLVGVNFPDGISNFIRLRVCQGGNLRSDIHTEHTGGPVNVLERIAADVAADPAAIGYSGFANLRAGAKIIAVSEAGRHYLCGTRAEVGSAEYPLTRFIYIFADRKPGHGLPPLARAFLQYVISPAGQALAATDNIYMPLPPAAAARERKELY